MSAGGRRRNIFQTSRLALKKQEEVDKFFLDARERHGREENYHLLMI
jgi:hypothetical protein